MATEGNNTLWQPIAEELFAQGYEISACLSITANSILLKGKQLLMSRDVAIKVLANLAAESGVAFERFQQEAKLLASFQHPNIVCMYGVGRLNDGRTYMVMEYVHGTSLAELLKAGRNFSEKEIRNYAAQICRALAYSHNMKVVHRDLKPANVLIQDFEGEPIAKIIDFGIHKSSSETGSQQLTLEGSFAGTANYMSPEQCRSGKVDARSDIYSLGCLLYELCCGNPPMEADTEWMILSNHLNKEITRIPSRLPISKQLENVILGCLKKKPEDRWPDMQTVQEILESEFKAQSGKKALLMVAYVSLLLLISYGAINYLPQYLKKNPTSVEVNDPSFNMSWDAFAGNPRNIQSDRVMRCRQWLEKHMNDESALGYLSQCFANCQPVNWDRGHYFCALICKKADEALAAKLYRKPGRNLYRYDLYAVKRECAVAISDFPLAEEMLSQIMPDNDKIFLEYKIKDFSSLFYAYEHSSAFDKAIALLNKYQKQVSNYPEEYAAYLSKATTWSFEKNQPEKAAEFGSRALREYSKLKDLNGYENFASFMQFQNDHGNQREVAPLTSYFDHGLDKSEAQALACTECIKANQSIGDFKTANKLIKVLKGSKFSKSSAYVAYKLQVLDLYSALMSGNRELAKSRLLPLLRRAEQTKDKAHYEYNTICDACGYFPEFIPICLPVLRKKSPEFVAFMYAASAHNLRSSNHLKEALKNYELCQQAFDKSNYLAGRVNVFLGQACCYEGLHEYGKAHECVSLGRKYLHEDDTSELHLSLDLKDAMIFREEGKAAETIKLCRENLSNAFAVRNIFPNLFAASVLDAFEAYVFFGEKKKALELCDKYLPYLDSNDPSIGSIVKRLTKMRDDVAREAPSLKVGK